LSELNCKYLYTSYVHGNSQAKLAESTYLIPAYVFQLFCHKKLLLLLKM